MAGGSGCVVDGEIGAPETTRARNVNTVPGSSLPFQERKGGGFNANLLLSAFQVVVWLDRSEVAAEKRPLNFTTSSDGSTRPRVFLVWHGLGIDARVGGLVMRYWVRSDFFRPPAG
jgi:hypothetical protein